MLKRRAFAVVLTVGLACAGLAAPANATDDPAPLPVGPVDLPNSVGRADSDAAPRSADPSKRQAYLLKLGVKPTSKVYRTSGRKAARNQLSRIEAAQQDVIADLPAKSPVLYTTHAVLSGVAVTTKASNLEKLEDIDGVAAVYPIAPKTRSLSTSIPLQGGPAAWESAGTGAGTSIAIIDSGIDYTHADFGGLGTEQAFEDAKAIDDDSWKTPKVVDGYDFAGDDYTGYNDPTPDANPLDCVRNGHGTHVAGIAAGQGVQSDGSTYTGPYNTSTDFSAMKIGPGMAPEADLYALRVFGCEGSTWLVTEAIDWAMDPDGDPGTDDAVDVINMSLGSDFGSPDDADAIVSNAAVDAGIVVVASAGNGGDITDIAGSPANAKKAISVANSVDATSIIDGATVTIDGTQDTFGVTRAVLYDWATKPDLSGDVVEAPNSNPDACAPFSNDEAADIAGKVVLVKWTQEALECGSITRGANLRAAGAIGFIFANSAETFDAGINGDTDIPGVLMVKSGADAIRAALQETKVVTADSTTPNAVTQDFPEDTDKVNTSSSRGIRVEGNLKPDIAAVGSSVFSAAVGKGTEGVSETGTSMSGPTVAGLAALVVQANPTWTPTQVKASIMNTASDLRLYGQDGGERYAPVRVGAGRIQAAKAVDNAVVAEVADDPGAVSVSFGPVEVSGPTTLTKTVNVTNTGVDDVDYDVRYDAITRVAGTSFTVSPETVSVKGGTTEQVTVTFTATGRKALDNTVDPTVGRWSNIGWPRTTLAEASGHVLFTPTSGNQLRVPVYAAPRPVSSLTGGTEVALDPVTGEGTLSMVGEGLGFPFNGTSDEDAENDITSIGAAFELSAVDPVEPECTPIVTDCVLLPIEKSADIRRVGVTTDGNMAYFAVGVDEPWSTPAGVTQLEVLLDTNGNGIEDHSIFTTRLSETDVMVAALYDFVEQEVIDVQYMNALPGTVDTQLYDSDTVVLPLDLDALASAGIDVTNPRVNYALLGWSAYAQFPIDAVGFDDDDYLDLSVDLFTPGLSAVASNGQPFYEETAGTDLQITRDAQVYQDNESLGLMLVHLHNGVGAKSEVLDVLDAPGATTSTLGTTAPSVEVNTPADLSVAVTGVAGTPTGQVEVVSAQTGAVLATGDLNGSGIAALTYTPTSTGTVRMIARYLGDTANAASTSAETTLTVTPTPVPGATTTTLAVKPSSVVRGASVTLDITVAGAQGTPTGQVSVVDRATNVVVGTRDLSAGKATLTFTPTTAGVLVLQATYAGDATFAQSRSVFHRVKVTKAASKVSLKLSSKSGKAKAKVTATIKVPTVNGIRATGRVELLDNGDVVGKAKLSKGKVKVTYKPKGKGKHLLRASYDGDANYLAGLSPRRTYMVK